MKNIKLVAADMDHTLLTEKGELPPNFSEYVNKLDELGVCFTIASGRPLFTLQSTFSNIKDKMAFISDNGGCVCYHGEIIYTNIIEYEKYRELIEFVEEETKGIAILCGLDTTYISSKYIEYEVFFRKFYTSLKFSDNLREVNCLVDKFTIFFPDKDSKPHYEKIFKPKFGNDFNVTVGDAIWVDIMNKGVDKGAAMRVLGNELGITSSQMMAFGDTYNDIEMLEAVEFSYIVANAADEMKKYAKYITASNDEYGVTKVLDELIETRCNTD